MSAFSFSPTGFTISAGALPAGIQLDVFGGGTTAQISGFPTTPGPFSFTLEFADPAGNKATPQTFTGNVVIAPVLSCTNTAGPSVTGVPYTTTCSVTGGTPPYSWATSGLPLPAGIALSATTGNPISISGSPTTVGQYSYILQATDSQSEVSTTQTFSGTIVSQPSISCLTFGTAEVGDVYEVSCTGSGGVQPYVFSTTGTLPAGLSSILRFGPL